MGKFETDSAPKRPAYPLRMALLGGVSVLPMAAVFFSAAPGAAYASCPPPVSSSVTGPVDTTAECDFSVTSAGAVSGGVTGVSNSVSVGALTNQGSISGSSYGINNTGTGTIGTLTNSGTISEAGGTGTRLDAIINDGLITALINAQNATIIGTNTGVANQYDGAIGTLTNSGVITGQNYDGIDAQNPITVLDNTATGTITGFYDGVVTKNIGTIINAGTITGGYNGILVSGSIGTLTNSGDIYSSRFYTGINVNNGAIGILSNTGTISGAYYGVNDSTSIATLTNNGTITGATGGFVNYLSIDALINETSGTLVGSISGGIGILSETELNTPGTIGLLMNGLAGPSITADTVFGTITGVSNQSIIETLANNGTIYGGQYGIANSYHTQYVDLAIRAFALPQGDTQASIATLTNTGSITGGSTGIYNDAGYIGTLTNSGSITGNFGIHNTSYSGGAGTIAVLTNSGVISSSFTGIYNATGASIGTLTNSGSITGGNNAAIFNEGNIDTISSTGIIAGTDLGINNSSGSIGLVTNSGSVSGFLGIGNGGTIGTLSQSGGGTITGGTIGVLNEYLGSITQLTNGLAGGGITADTIFGSITGVSNSGAFISNLTNNGTIAGGIYGIANSVNTPPVEDAIRRFTALLTNNQNQGSIATLTNNGIISGVSSGIYNNGGYIGTLTNNATIIGTTDAGIDNDPSGTIDTLVNNAIITGGTSGIHNNGTIGTLTNSGTISGAAFGIKRRRLHRPAYQ